MSKQATKWTAGPWHIRGKYVVERQDGRVICRTNIEHNDEQEEEENTRLIAQAPAMAELLHRLSDARENGFDNYNGLIDTAERILAKIEGQ